MSSVDDLEAIRALVHEYCFRLDAGDLDGVAALFDHADLGSSIRPERAHGSAQARRNYDGVMIYDDGTPKTLHCITNLTIAVDPAGFTATARSYFTVLQQVAAATLQPIIAGQYRDRFEKVDGTWRFTERVIHPDLIGDLSNHMDPRWIPRR